MAHDTRQAHSLSGCGSFDFHAHCYLIPRNLFIRSFFSVAANPRADTAAQQQIPWLLQLKR